LPQDASVSRRHVSDVSSFDGVSRYADSVSGISPNVNNGEWLALDGTAAQPAAWAIWRFPLPAAPNDSFQQFQVNCTPSGKYYVALGDYTRSRWAFYDLAAHPDGEFGSITINPAVLPDGETALHSPGGFGYIAVLTIGQNVQVKGIDVTTPTPAPPPGTDSIFDQFENNDTLATAYALAPGLYRASIHQSAAPMADPNETRDPVDCYSVAVPAGQVLTLTLRHEVYDHFGSGFLSDLDILFYTNPGASSVYNDFDENLSSVGIFYDPFEQVNWTNATGSDQTMRFAIVGDISEPGVRNNAEYDLGVFVSPAVNQVSGKITQGGGKDLNSDVVVFLEPGDFNANTPVPGNGVPGGFSITGVPPGMYTLKVHSSARLDPPGYEWAQSVAVDVTGGDVSGVTLDLDQDPPAG
jgi:hypothetical protein